MVGAEGPEVVDIKTLADGAAEPRERKPRKKRRTKT
jgi:hypothetical protein